MKHDRETVLTLWGDGHACATIAQRTGASPEYIRTIVQRARANGDPRAENRARGGWNRFAISRLAYQNLVREVEKRGTTEHHLVSMILEAVAGAKLFKAVLDD